MRFPGNYDTLLLQFTCGKLVAYFFDKKEEHEVLCCLILSSRKLKFDTVNQYRSIFMYSLFFNYAAFLQQFGHNAIDEHVNPFFITWTVGSYAISATIAKIKVRITGQLFSHLTLFALGEVSEEHNYRIMVELILPCTVRILFNINCNPFKTFSFLRR